MAETAPIITVEGISKTFNIPDREPVRALRNVTNHVDRGEVLVLIGPSGSGKSTFLRALNGLETVDSGRILIDGVELTGRKTNLNRLRQEVGVSALQPLSAQDRSPEHHSATDGRPPALAERG